MDTVVIREFFFDTETWSDIPIKYGRRYFERVELLLFQWAFDDGPVSVWDVAGGEPCPAAVEEAANDPECVWWGHNSGKFDWPVLEHTMPWIAAAVGPHRRRDTMVQAYSHSLPGALEMLCDALGVAQEKRKLKTGRDLMRIFCIPPGKNVKRERATVVSHPVEWQQFKEYAGQDIVAMRACRRRMPTWNYPSVAPNGEEWMAGMRGKAKQLILEQTDLRINDRGVCMDLELAEAAVRATDIAKQGLAVRTRELTEDDVTSATQRDKMLRHILSTYGVELPDMQKDTIERRAADESLPEELRELLRVRLMSTTSSVAKFTTLLNAVSSDGRLRGTMQFRGAGRTGRQAHRLMQLGNMPRPDMKADEIAWAIDLLKMDAVHLVYDNVMKVCSNAIRGTIIAPPGRKLVVGDLASIEGRVTAWLAGEETELQAYRDYDTILPGEFDAKGKPARKGPDLYVKAYMVSFNVDDPMLVDSSMRQIGKVETLMFGFGGGVGAWITGAATYGIDLVQMTEQVYDTLPDWAVKEAEDFLQYLYRDHQAKHATAIAAGKSAVEEQAKLEARCLKARHTLTERVFVACDAIKRLWRKARPMTTSYWKELENTVEACILDPGTTRQCRRLKVRRDGEWLRIGLPSGRALCYPSPRLNYSRKEEGLETRISYLGLDQYTKRWQRIGTYGGRLLENAVQAVAADQFFECGPAIEAAGFEIVQTVHDEFICEAPIDRDDLNPELLGAMMTADLGWNAGLPLAAAGWEDFRYKKD